MKKALATIAALCLLAGAAAQFNETNHLFYHSFRTPNSLYDNAALYPLNNSFYLQLPGFENRFGGPLALGDIVRYDEAQDITVVDLNSMLNALDENNKLRLGIEMPLIGFGFKIGNTFVDFNTRFNNRINVGIPTHAITALLKGNTDESGNAITELNLLDGDLFNMQSYIEVGIGAGHTFKPLGLTVGARAKLLYGVLGMQTDQTRVTLNTDNAYDQVSATVYYEAQQAACLQWNTSGSGAPVVFNGISDLLSFKNNNLGFSFDLGAKYEMGPFTFSAAINDLSAGIHWTKNVNTIRPEGGQGTFVFDGMNVSALLNGGELNTDSLSSTYEETLNGLAPHTTFDSGDFWMGIPTKINLGASYNFAKLLRAGVLFHGQFDRGLLSRTNSMQLDLSDNVTNTFRFNTTLSLGVNLFNWAEVIVGSSVVYDGSKISWLNPGAGIILTPGTIVQTFIMADYVSSLKLAEAKAFNIKFGINLLIGKGGRSKIVPTE